STAPLSSYRKAATTSPPWVAWCGRSCGAPPASARERPAVGDIGRLEEEPLAFGEHRRQRRRQHLVLAPRRVAGRVLVEQRPSLVVGAPRGRAVGECFGEDDD